MIHSTVRYRRYAAVYKYKLASDVKFRVDPRIFGPIVNVVTRYIVYEGDGVLRVCKGYAWDGASGPTKDTRSSIRSSLLHDAFYQMFREGQLNLKWRRYADDMLYNICVEDGMPKWRAYYWWLAVRWFAKRAATEPRLGSGVLEAP